MEQTRTCPRKELSFCVVAISLLAMVGCGPRDRETAPVTGTVTYRAQPVAGANVMFICPDGRSAHGVTDASGRFNLQTFDASDGAILGEHTVVTTKIAPLNPDAPAPESDLLDAHSPHQAVRELLPQRYTSPLDSPLRATVNAGKENDFSFNLTD